MILAALELLDKREQYLVELRQQIEIGESQIQQGKVAEGEVVLNRLAQFPNMGKRYNEIKAKQISEILLWKITSYFTFLDLTG